MTINTNHWKPPFANFPSWLCPSCQSGTLVLKKDTFKCFETGVSEKLHSHEAWDGDWIDERFVGLLICQNAGCGEIVAVGGRTYHIENFDLGSDEQNWDCVFEPTFMYPAPPVFPIPGMCPKTVAAPLKKAFSLFWSDLGSCANRLRAAVETLLDERKIPRTTPNKNRRREPIPLHVRIEKFTQVDPRSGRFLLAIKWIGNAGSHANLNEVSRDDMLNGFELFEQVVELVYVRRDSI
jgi:hypothetical protein